MNRWTAAQSLGMVGEPDSAREPTEKASMAKKKRPVCRKCGSKYYDPIMQNPLSDGEDFCTWCAFHQGEPQPFLMLRNIPSEPKDKRILAAETDLQGWAKQKLEDPADFDWYSGFFQWHVLWEKVE